MLQLELDFGAIGRLHLLLNLSSVKVLQLLHNQEAALPASTSRKTDNGGVPLG